MMMRKVYRDRLFAIGTGNFRWVPGGDYADHDAVSFNIVWSSADRFRYLECNHPYWYSDGELPERHPDAWSKGSISPFQQTAHHENTAIVLYNIPDKDPWPGKPSPDKWAWRDGHAEKLLARGQFRYPKSVDETVEKSGWIFLREGKVYIAAKPLRDYYIQTNVAHKDMEGFNVVKSDFNRCGFVFEVGMETDFGSFSSFQDRVVRNPLKVDWEKMTVSYTNSKKDILEIQYQSGLPEAAENPVPEHWAKHGIKGMAESVPVVTVNGKKDPPYRDWPVIGSPWINLKNGVLEINDGKARIVVDWRGELPVITGR
jgi:hypothetical protein